jgi:hypothetical protein
MSSDDSRVARRSFLSRFGTGATALGAALGASVLPGRAQSAPAAGAAWQPARHAEDDWFEQPSAKHRFFLDTTSPAALGHAIFFANNYFSASKASYGLADTDSAIVICVRHQSTSFAFTDAMWAKYGTMLSERAVFTDPKTTKAPTVNVFQATGAAGYGALLSNNGVTLDAVITRGLRLAVCSLATRAIAGLVAQRTGGKVDDIIKELTDNLVPNAHMVPAGIVAVNRAQERGYSFAYVAS